MLSARGRVQVALVTPEDEPLFLFGREASEAIRALLDEHGVALHTGFFVTAFEGRKVRMLPPKTLEADVVLALPTLRGPASTASRRRVMASSSSTTSGAWAAYPTCTPRATSPASPSSRAGSRRSRPMPPRSTSPLLRAPTWCRSRFVPSSAAS